MARIQILETGSTLTAEKAKTMIRDNQANGKKLTPRQRRYFGYIAGGGIPKAQNGADMGAGQGGLIVENNNYSPMTEDGFMIGGKSHADGGTKMSYMGNTVEAEAGEPAIISPKTGDLTIYGNLKNPLSGNKFKTDAKTLLQKEQRVNKLMDYSTALVNNNDPYNKWSRLKFNSGNAMMTGAGIKKKQLQESKEHLGDIQEAILGMSDDLGVDPQKLSQGKFEARKGLRMKNYQVGGEIPGSEHNNLYLYRHRNDQLAPTQPQVGLYPPPPGGKLSLAQRHNNPGNLKYAPWMQKYGAVQGEPGKDGGVFAKFPDVQHGQQAMVALLKDPKYQGRTVQDAIKRWTNNSPYATIPDDIRGRKISSLDNQQFTSLLNTITKGEDNKMYNWENVNTPPQNQQTSQPPYNAGRVGGGNPQFPQEQYNPQRVKPGGNYDFNLQEPKQYTVGTNAKGLEFNQIAPELFAAATNRREPVFAQKYQPELFEPYQVSFQDRRNLNNQTFRAVSQRLGDNPGALSQLASQKYEADNQVNADEFRTNQQINNEITNKNIGLLNDTQGKNLTIADQQYIRASQAKSNTKAVNQAVISSISSKIAQNKLENRTLQTYENLYPHYRYDNQYQLQKEGAPGGEYLNTSGVGVGGGNNGTAPGYDSRTRVNYDNTGKMKSYTRINQSELDTATKQAKLQDEGNKSMNSLFRGKVQYNFPLRKY